MKKKLIYWLIWLPSALSFVAILYWYSSQSKKAPNVHSEATDSEDHVHTFDMTKYIELQKRKLSAEDMFVLDKTEKLHSSDRSHTKNYMRLADFWNTKSSTAGGAVRNTLLANYYIYLNAVQDSSPQLLTFASRSLALIAQQVQIPAMRNAILDLAKDGFERAYALQPNNDSLLVDIGSLMLWYNSSDVSPMQGIGIIKEVLAKNPTNIYARYMLGLASMMSGQYDKAEYRFNHILKQDKTHVSSMIAIAQLHEIRGSNDNAKMWYKKAMQHTKDSAISAEVIEKIKNL